MKVKQKVLLIIMDGLGAAPKNDGNAVVLANPENLSTLWNTFPHTYLLASGESVGLPKNVKGNSEVGHLNLGAGSVVYQSLPRINKAIERGLLDSNKILQKLLEHTQRHKSNIHMIGIMSDGSVHSHINHFKSLIDFFAKKNFENNLYIHAVTDGRDTPPTSAVTYLSDIDKHMLDRGMGKIGTVIGRYYAMDRNRKWDRTQRAYYLLEKNTGTESRMYQKTIEDSYTNRITDEFLEPIVVNESKIQPNDAVLMMNFRPDRAIQLTEALISDTFDGFVREKIPNLFLAGIVEYRKDFPENIIIPKQNIANPLGSIISSHGLEQLRIAESEKFPHVTYFFNGGVPNQYAQEDRVFIPSPKVATYDLKPETSSFEITNTLLTRISSQKYDFILVNLASPDLVGHTGNIEAGIKSVQAVDRCVSELVKAFTALGGAVVITADHGNVEEMINLETGSMDTEHSINPVPVIVVGTETKPRGLPYGSLRDVAPTILDIMGIPKPSEMTGQSLIRTI